MNKIIKKSPRHIGIIIDGNRRWAKKRGLPALEGHRRGFENVKEMIKWCTARELNILTFYAFSTENWNRSQREVNYLMRLLLKAMNKKYVKKVEKEKIGIRLMGQRERLPKFLQKSIKDAEELTKDNKEKIVNFAISYGGRAEIVEAVKKIVKQKIAPNRITEDLVSQNLWTRELPDPDLIIRTGGEKRISNFLIWQGAYSELYFYDKFWPDFTEKDLDAALKYFASRSRRFGK